ncbi:MAG: CDP-diacylglycerol--serine O-phosphatidyltransferase [Candidatus Marinimicrobia bacterium]|nr:CDP-diacylglycerol--serine O-phosphatidyltransferase [Candidatus Neomarinimicrobiota bacterium]
MKLRKPIKRHHIPSIFTLINMFLGFLAVISIVEGVYIRAAYLIAAAGIFDVIDGKLARKIEMPSRFGAELDSLADLISFCLAPALLVWALYAQDLHPILGALVAGSPLLFGAMRLARFNLLTGEGPKPYYEGLPSPIAAYLVVALVIYYETQGHAGAGKVVLPMVMATSFLMVSQVKYGKFPTASLHMGAMNTLRLVSAIGTMTIFFLVDTRVLLPMVIFYLVSGLVRHLSRTPAEVEDIPATESKV